MLYVTQIYASECSLASSQLFRVFVERAVFVCEAVRLCVLWCFNPGALCIFLPLACVGVIYANAELCRYVSRLIRRPKYVPSQHGKYRQNWWTLIVWIKQFSRFCKVELSQKWPPPHLTTSAYDPSCIGPCGRQLMPSSSQSCISTAAPKTNQKKKNLG